MTNLALRNLYGYGINGDTLRNERRLVDRTGFDLRGVISEVSLQDCPLKVQEFAAQAAESKPESPPEGPPMSSVVCESEPPLPNKQLVLF